MPIGTGALSAQALRPSLSDNASIDQSPVVLPSNAGSLATGLQVFDPAQLDHRPVPTSPLLPNYPFEMKRKGISGEVFVDFTVGVDGRVHDAVIARASRGEFERAAVEAVSDWRFKPGLKGGHAVSTRMRVPIFFNPNSHD